MAYRNLRKKLYVMLAFSLCLSVIPGGTPAYAKSGPEAYIYSFWGNTVAAPPAYKATTLLTGANIGVGNFRSPSDIYVSSDNEIYVADSGNNRIVVLNSQYTQQGTIESFDRDGQEDHFNNPQGVFVTDKGHVYIADTGNKRVVHLDQNGRLVKIVEAPQSELSAANFNFQPVRVVVDQALRIYVMSVGVFDGFMEFNAEGEFTSFFGANRVNVDPVEYFWKMVSTREQRAQMVMFTPTEFTNLDINSESFIYATNGDNYGDNIKMLNAQGTDILRREGYYPPQGDIRYFADEGRSRLIDIDVMDSDIYSVLDSRRGRIFTYNGDGHLMYIFGGIGNQLGQFNTPIAMDRMGDQFLVLDRALGEITVFETTEYGRVLNEAVRSYYRGDEETAFGMYTQAINMNANLEFAYTGIGKALLRQGDYYEAMQYFRESMDQENYSKAYLLYRKEILREHFSTIMTAMIVIVLAVLIGMRLRKLMVRRRGVSID